MDSIFKRFTECTPKDIHENLMFRLLDELHASGLYSFHTEHPDAQQAILASVKNNFLEYIGIQEDKELIPVHPSRIEGFVENDNT